jgi:hypothetical protein
MKKFNVYALFAILVLCTFTVSPAIARLTTSGIEFKADAAQGEHVLHNLTVSLSSDETKSQKIEVNILDWYQNPSGRNRALMENPDIAPYSAKGFLSASPKNFTIAPGASQKVKIDGIMPAGDGGRYAIVSLRLMPNATTMSEGIGISVGINALVILTISGSELLKTGEIENLSIEEPISSKHQNITAEFKNTGNYHYKINATAYLKDSKGDILATASPKIEESLLPTSKRMIRFSLIPKSELKPGTYTVEADVALTNNTILATEETKFELKP